MISPSSRAHRSGPPTPLPAAPGEVYIRKIFYCLEWRSFVRKRRGCSAGGEEPAVNSERRRETQGPCGAPARGPISPLLPREGAAGLPAGPGAKPCFWSRRREVPADSGCCRGGEQAEPGSTMLRPQGWAAPVPTAAPTTRPVKTHPSPWYEPRRMASLRRSPPLSPPDEVRSGARSELPPPLPGLGQRAREHRELSPEPPPG